MNNYIEVDGILFPITYIDGIPIIDYPSSQIYVGDVPKRDTEKNKKPLLNK